MVRRALTAAGLGVAAIGLSLSGSAPASADGGDTVAAGTFEGRLTMTSTDPNMGGSAVVPGQRSLQFGQGCAAGSACTITRMSGNSSIAQPLTSGGGGFGWAGSDTLACLSRDTGAMLTANGFVLRYSVTLAPSRTTTTDGVTYVTALTGTYDAALRVTRAGQAKNCTLDPDRVGSAKEHGTYSFTLAPLATPTPLAESPAIALSHAESKASIAGFRLPQSREQRTSARAVADGTRSSVPGALETPTQALRSIPRRLPQDLLLLAVLGLLIVFPSQLFNSTYEANHDRIDRQLSRWRVRRRRPSAATGTGGATPSSLPDAPPAPSVPAVVPRWRRLGVFVACALAGTLLAGFLDPGFGADQASFALLTGVFLAVLVTILVAVVAGRGYRSASHHDSEWHVEAIPSALLVAVLCVVVSRLTHFEPGYLYGVLGGAVFVVALSRRAEGRSEVAASVATLLLALGSWVVFEPLSRAASGADASYPTLALDSLLASVFIGGLEGMLFGLVPLQFLPGSRIKNWSWTAWVVLMATVGFLFVHVLLMPESGYLGRSTSASVSTTISLLVAFAIVSLLFWGYFRWRPSPSPGTGADSSLAMVSEPATSPVPDVACEAIAEANVVPSRTPRPAPRRHPSTDDLS